MIKTGFSYDVLTRQQGTFITASMPSADAATAFMDQWVAQFLPDPLDDRDETFYALFHFINLLLPLLGDAPEYKPRSDRTANHVLWVAPKEMTPESFLSIHNTVCLQTKWMLRRVEFGPHHIFALVTAVQSVMKDDPWRDVISDIPIADPDPSQPSQPSQSSQGATVRRQRLKWRQGKKYRDLWRKIYNISHEVTGNPPSASLKSTYNQKTLVSDFKRSRTGKTVDATRTSFNLYPSLHAPLLLEYVDEDVVMLD